MFWSHRVEGVNGAGRWRGRRERVLLHHLQSLHRTVCDRRAQFNEAVFLVFSPPSPQMALLFLLLLPCTLCSRLCAYLPFSYPLTSVSSLTAHFLLPPHPTLPFQYLCAPISLRWIIAPRTALPTQVQIMSLPRERCYLSRARLSKVLISVTVITDEHASRRVIEGGMPAIVILDTLNWIFPQLHIIYLAFCLQPPVEILSFSFTLKLIPLLFLAHFTDE